jgi:hypothetical protein
METDTVSSVATATPRTLESLTTRELAALWCREFERTTGRIATVLEEKGPWVHLEYHGERAERAWRRDHLLAAIPVLQSRPDHVAE